MGQLRRGLEGSGRCYQNLWGVSIKEQWLFQGWRTGSLRRWRPGGKNWREQGGVEIRTRQGHRGSIKSASRVADRFEEFGIALELSRGLREGLWRGRGLWGQMSQEGTCGLDSGTRKRFRVGIQEPSGTRLGAEEGCSALG